MAVHDAAGESKRYSSDDYPKRNGKSKLKNDPCLLVSTVTEKTCKQKALFFEI